MPLIVIELTNEPVQTLELAPALVQRAELKASIKEMEAEVAAIDTGLMTALGAPKDMIAALKKADVTDEEVKELVASCTKIETETHTVSLTAFLKDGYSKEALLEAGVTIRQLKAAAKKALVAYPNVRAKKEQPWII